MVKHIARWFKSINGFKEKLTGYPLKSFLLFLFSLVSFYFNKKLKNQGKKLAKLEYENTQNKLKAEKKAHEAVKKQIEAEKKELEIENEKFDKKIEKIDKKINEIKEERKKVKVINEDTNALLSNLRKYVDKS